MHSVALQLKACMDGSTCLVLVETKMSWVVGGGTSYGGRAGHDG